MNIAYLTSCRELVDGESSGRFVVDRESGKALGYRPSLLESMCSRAQTASEDVFTSIRFARVLVDDDTTEITRTGYPWPKDLLVPTPGPLPGSAVWTPVADITRHITSLPLRALRGDTRVTGVHRSIAKSLFERTLVNELRESAVDVVVCDSFMVVFEHEFLTEYQGTVINVHPGITDSNDPGWLPGPTPTRDAVTRARHGYVIVDDKHRVPHPKGVATAVMIDGRARQVVHVPRLGRTGVTAHKLTHVVDGGPILAEVAYNFESQHVTEEMIRSWNYALKVHVLAAALRPILDHRQPTSTASAQ